MTIATKWWSGELLGPGPVGFALFPQSLTVNLPALGAASSGNQSFVLLPHDLGAFLQQHADTVLVCHDAAALHWLIHDYLTEQNDSDSLQTLWRLSAEYRLIDIQILDQQVRRFHGQGATETRSLAELAQHYTQAPLPNDSDIQDRVAIAWAHQQPDAAILDLVAGVAATILHVYGKLQIAAETIMAAVEDSNRTVEFNSPLPSEIQEQLKAKTERLIANCVARGKETPQDPADQHLNDFSDAGFVALPRDLDYSPPETFGLLGVGLDVQGAIAVQAIGRTPRNCRPGSSAADPGTKRENVPRGVGTSDQ